MIAVLAWGGSGANAHGDRIDDVHDAHTKYETVLHLTDSVFAFLADHDDDER